MQLQQQQVIDNASDLNRFKEQASYYEREKFNQKNQLDQFQREILRVNDEN